MLTDGQTLQKAICADPDNDLPRLVYADFLEENGQPDRAAFIRLQIEFVRKCLAGTGVADDVLRSELAVLWRAHGAAWRAELPQIPGVEWDLFFHRGFAERVVVETDTVLRDNAEAIVGLNPVHHLCVRQFTGARGVTLIPGLRRLKSATIILTMTDRAVDELLAWSDVPSKCRLDLFLRDGPALARAHHLSEYFWPLLRSSLNLRRVPG